MTSGRSTLVRHAAVKRRFSVLIVGAGINGLAVFRELALQGVDCLIVDRGDFCGGTSAAPSRMIHGGLKYLENGEFRLVCEATLERNRLLRNAAHMVRPLETVVPLASRLGGIGTALRRFLGLPARGGERGQAVVGLGLALYDFLGRRERAMPRHRLLSGKGLRRLVPGIDRRFVAGALYYDAAIAYPERLGLELARDAMAADPGCIALNHVALEGKADATVVLRDRIRGRTFEVEPKIVVNAAGPWIDRANHALGHPSRHIGGTKGSHLVLDRPDLLERLRGRMVYFESRDGRICLVYPYLGRILLGSTDIPVEDPDGARCEDEEVAYMLAALGEVFPDVRVRPEEILSRYCGVRPLPRSDAADPGLVSRDHSVPLAEPEPGRPFPILSLVGGKWTTFRAFGEEVADDVLLRLGVERRRSTRELAIGGGAGFPADAEAWALDLSVRTGLSEERARTLLERYGTAAEAVAAYCRGGQDAPLTALPDYSHRELRCLAEREMVARLSDLVLGRTLFALTGRLSAEALEEVSRVAAEALGWDERRRGEEMALVRALLAERHGVEIPETAPGLAR